MITRWFIAATSAILFTGLACGPQPPGTLTPRDRDLLTHDEIVRNAKEGADMYETLQALRPHFIEPPLGIQRTSAPQGTAVYIDSRRAGNLETLRNLTAGNVDEVRYLGPTQSQNEFGPTATLVTLMIKLRHARADTTFEVAVPHP